ncbi:putative reverse transcriptase domain-containing protein [Tanacetum coccineum]
MVDDDASHKGLGFVLMQRDKVIAYASGKLKKHERNNMTYDVELGAVKYHPGKANVVADALGRKERLRPLQVRALGMLVRTSLKYRILDAYGEAMKEENLENETLYGAYQKFEIWFDGFQHVKGRA